MLKIKLARFGKRNQPHFRMVINEDRDKRDGAYVAQIGHYSPAQVPKILEIDVAEYKAWLKKGAQPTPTVAALFKRFQSGNPFPPKKAQLSRKAKAKLAKPKEEVKEESKAEPKEEPAKEEVVAEAKTAAEKPVEPAVEEIPAEAKPATEPTLKS
jgi:small subunit ribosomal protein S16